MVITAQNINQKSGYKQTEVGVIPEDWEVHTLGDEIDQLEAGVSVNSVDEEFHVYAHEQAILKTSSVSNGYFLPHENKKIAPRDIKRAKLNPRVDSIIISRMNTPDLVGECGYVEKDYQNLFLPDRLWMTRIKRESKINVKWLSYLLSYKEYKVKIKSAATGTSGSMKNISKSSLLSINIPFPSAKEQSAIATALSDVDALITSLDRLIAKKRDIKQATMQQLLTGKTRLPGLSEEWEVKKLGEITEVIMGQSPVGTSYNRDGYGYPLINGPTEFTDRYPIKIQWTNQPTKFCKQNDILLCVRGSSTGRINIANDDYCIGRGIAAIRAKAGVDAQYITFQVDCAVKNILALTTGSTFPNIDGKSIRSIEFPLPVYSEQQAIANILTDMDAEIVSLELKRDKTRALKQGMMQELLTGKTRLI